MLYISVYDDLRAETIWEYLWLICSNGEGESGEDNKENRYFKIVHMQVGIKSSIL